MKILNKSVKSVKRNVLSIGREIKSCSHFYSRVFRGCVLSYNMVGIGKSKYLTYPRKVHFIKLSLTDPKGNIKLMKSNFLKNMRFIRKTIK